MTRDDMMLFAQQWIDNWNRRDIAAVLAHFADTAVFVSPLAPKYAGTTTLVGKAAIGAYWTAGLQRITSLRFTLDHALWDAELRELTVVYAAELNAPPQRATEVMTFDPTGTQLRGEAFYGAMLG